MESSCAHLLLKIPFLVLLILGLLRFGIGSAMDFRKTRSKRSWPLLFTNTSTSTFICGFGIPVNDLTLELVTVGMVLKAPQILPSTVKALKQLSSHGIARQIMHEKEISNPNNYTKVFKEVTLYNYRVYFYKALEQLSTSSDSERRRQRSYFIKYTLSGYNKIKESTSKSDIWLHDTTEEIRVLWYRCFYFAHCGLGQNGHKCVLKMICEANTVPFHYWNGVLGEILHILFKPSSSHDVYAKTDYDYFKAEELGKSGLSCEKIYQDCSESILERVTRIFE